MRAHTNKHTCTHALTNICFRLAEKEERAVLKRGGIHLSLFSDALTNFQVRGVRRERREGKIMLAIARTVHAASHQQSTERGRLATIARDTRAKSVSGYVTGYEWRMR
mmetsp:Transcript_39431/g.77589  ORF Transcript_39431/g.77589 Transcript_39431/m.77589 type:complete len:108 (+) Transcript_39431:2471-2794(+)